MSIQSAIAQTANLITQVVNQAVVRPTGSPGLTGISGFLFDIVAVEDVTLQSEITDHYVEANYAVQDHIAIKPERFTVKGYSGELTDALPEAAQTIISIADKAATLATMAPQFAQQAEQLYSQIASGKSSISQIINSSTSVFDIFNQMITVATRQQAAFNYFYSMWLARQLCTVETPWNVFTDMAIETVRGMQDETTKMISEFSVTFKKIRKAEVIFSVGIDLSAIAPRVANQVVPFANQGIGSGLPAEANIVFGAGALKKAED